MLHRASGFSVTQGKALLSKANVFCSYVSLYKHKYFQLYFIFQLELRLTLDSFSVCLYFK